MKKILLLSFMLLLTFCFSAWAQERTVSGKVADQASEGLPGVNVILKGTTTGTTTDIDGNYRLSVPSDGGTLVFSFIGLKTQEVEIGARSVIDVTMSEDVETLSEVVVTAFGIERAANEVTYQTEKLDSESLMQAQQQNAGAGLAGKVAGLQINVNNNGVNPSTQIQLRGFRSITRQNQALVVIDGAIANIGAFNNLNPSDIESVNLLKGANAAALYGSQAANGALIVTTKRGKVGQAFTVGINSSYTLEEVSFLPDFQTEHGIGWDGHYNAIENTNWGPRFDGVSRLVGPDFPDDYPVADQVIPYAPIADNLRDFFETGSTLQNTVYASGGDESGSFYLSYGNVNTEGIYLGDTYKRNTFRVNANKKIGKLSFGVSSTFFEDDTDVVHDDIGDQDREMNWFILNTPANIPLKDYKDWDNPLSYGYADNYYNAFYQNPYWALGTNRDTDQTRRLVANINGEYAITEAINLGARIGMNSHAGQGQEWRDAQEYDEELQPFHSAVSSYLVDSEFQRLDLNGQVLATGTFNLSSELTLKPIVGAAFISNSWQASATTVNNLSIPGFYDVSNGTGAPVAEKDNTDYRNFGVFADVTLGFREYLFLNLTGRQDYTSTLALDDNGYFYPSASVSFILSEAVPAITSNPVLSFAKVTVSNSTVYNDLGVYQLNEVWQQQPRFPLGTVNGFRQTRIAVDENIQKEKLSTIEAGLNVGFLNDRFSLDAAYYSTTTTDLITRTTPSITSGASSFDTNIGKMVTTGIEATISGQVLKVGDFTWDANVNFTHYKSVVKEIAPGLDEIVLDNYGTYGTFAIVGEAFPQLKAQSYVRDPNGRVVVDPATGNPIVGDLEAHGKGTPDYILGLNTTFGFKGVRLSATADYRTGHVFYSQGNDAMEFTGRSQESVSANRQDFIWPNSVIETGEGTYVENTIPVSGGVMGFWQNTYNEIKENYVRDATTFKLREVSLSYTLPSSIISSIGFIKKLTVGAIGRNLWIKFPSGQSRFSDPEFGATDTDNLGRSVNSANSRNLVNGYGQGFPTRSLGFNLNIEF